MSGKHEHRSTFVPGIPELFRSAVAALDRHVDDTPRDDATGRAAALRESARCLADAFLTARGHVPGNDVERARLLTTHTLVDHATDRVLIDLLRLDPHTDWTGARAQELRQLEQQYRALMPRLRSALVREMPEYGCAAQLLRNAAGKPWLKGAAAGVTAAVVLGTAAYGLTNPAYTLELSGQVFWQSTPGEPFTEQRSRMFSVRVDGQAHEYTIMFEEPIRISSLRLDPVNRVDATSVEIERIRVLDVSGGEHGGFDDPTLWTCVNCRWLSRSGHGGRLKPDNEDPYVIPPPVDPVGVSRIQISMRATAEKSFWEWITRLEKTN